MREGKTAYEDTLEREVHARIRIMLREAATYRMLVDAAPLHFCDCPPLWRTRRAVARALHRVAAAIATTEPAG